MPNCVVKGCKNQSTRDKKQDGITFHVFPFRDQDIKEKWIAVIRNSRKEPLWQPTRRSVICSAHFDSDDLYHTKKGLRRVRKNGYPKILPNVIEESDNVDLSQPQSVKEEPAAQDLSNDLNLSQPSSPCTIQVVQSDSSIFIISMERDLSESPTVKEEPAALDLSNDLNLSQPSSSYAVRAVQSDSSIFNIPREYKLEQRVSLLEKRLKQYKRKIKTLNQRVRRLHKRNKYLRERLDNHNIKYTGTGSEEANQFEA